MGVLSTIITILLGVFFWTLSEYFLHRFIFHGEETWLPDKKWAYLTHFLLHGIHHAFPQDRYRLVFPIVPGYCLLMLAYAPFLDTVFPACMAPAMKCGTALGYITYDLIHYFTHHASPKSGYFKSVKVYHMQHHYRNGELGYGVSSKFWDLVFRTELKL